MVGKIAEVTPDEQVARELYLGGDSTYRAFGCRGWANRPHCQLALRTVNSRRPFT
ncbi:MAG: hypothetical protein R2867_17695 [Caldilineaceae bacterium]